ncbi:MAG TPA: DMT family transporter [Steroidobacteraceae bacterium]|nr:DMT family transporter [Steroidobacteraceae bacterium]HNS27208.1 DMT family transporter [Steroidobacteraceae bacterium]
MPNRPLRGIAFMTAAVAVFAVMDALLKALTARYPPLQVAALRGAASLPFIALPLLLSGRAATLMPRRPGMHLLRGLLMVVVMGGFLYAVRSLSLADAYSIFLTAPLMVTALAALVLHEHVGWRRWLAILIGLGGALVMLRPSASGFATVAAIGALVAALGYACNAILLRVLTRTDTTASVALWSIAVMTVVAAAIALPAWVTVGRTDIWLIIALGVVGAVAQMCMIEAFRAAPASVIAPFEYSALFWGICIDWVVWQALPTLRVLAGGGIVIGCGLYIIWRERELTMRR